MYNQSPTIKHQNNNHQETDQEKDFMCDPLRFYDETLCLMINTRGQYFVSKYVLLLLN